MEEFYRKKYLSPNYIKHVPSYIQTIQKDKTITELRKELHEVKQMQDKFDELCLQISKVEKENKKLQTQQALMEGQYLEKIKKNKTKITDLKQNLLDCKQTLDDKTAKMTQLQKQTQQLLCELQRMKKQSQETLQQKTKNEVAIDMQQKLIEEIKRKLQLQKDSSIQMKKYNQLKSLQLSKSYEEYKKKQVQLKKQQTQCSSMQTEYQKLTKQKEELMKIAQLHRTKMQQSSRCLELQQMKYTQLESTHTNLDAQRQKQNKVWQSTWKDVKQNVCKTKDLSMKIKTNQCVLTDCMKNLEKDKIYLQKMMVKETLIMKNNQKLQQNVKHWQSVLAQEQSTYNRIISQMKMSIIQDQKAIQNLSKQANLLQTIIN